MSMKKYGFWFFLMCKRMVKRKAFVLFLLILPVLSFTITALEKQRAGDENGGAVAGIWWEGEAEEGSLQEDGQKPAGLQETAYIGETWIQRFTGLLSEQEGVIRFRFYEREADFLADISTGELDCGAVIPADMKELVMSDRWQGAITICHTSSSSMTEIVKERIASALFTLYAEERYTDYVEESEAFQEAVKGGSTRAEIVSFAKEAYETHLLDGSTFSFSYQEDGDEVIEEAGGAGQEGLSVFRLKGILALCIFVSGLCGLLTDWEDRKEKRFVGIVPSWMTTIVNIWVPTIFTSLAALLCLIPTNQYGIGKELCHLVFYQFLIVVYCSIIRLLVRRQELIATAIPILTLASMICSPVWIRLSLYLPAFSVLEKLFPVTYYLLL